MKIKIAIFTGTRAEYGLMRNLIKKINDDSHFDLYLIVSGTHFNKKYGETFNEIRSDFIKNNNIIPMPLDNFSDKKMAFQTGEVIKLVTCILEKLQPNYLLVLGDRFESFAAASASHILGLKNIHLHGGEKTLGAIDDKLRNAISQLSTYHFTSCEKHKKKVSEIVGSSSNVFNTGPLVLDGLLKLKKISKEEFQNKTGFIFGDINLLITFHSETLSKNYGIKAFSNLLKVLENYKCNILFTAPNSDDGTEQIIEKINLFIDKKPKENKFIPSLGQEIYLNALYLFDFVMGNSSSGIIEAPLLKTKVLNIGDRQKGRYKFGEVIDVSDDFQSISNAVKDLLTCNENTKLKHVDLKNLYKGKSPSDQIIKKLKQIC